MPNPSTDLGGNGAVKLARRLRLPLALAIAAAGLAAARVGGAIAALEALLLLGAFLAFAFDLRLLRPAIPAALAVGLGLAPQTAFLLGYDAGFHHLRLAGSPAEIEPALAGTWARYEDLMLWLHARLKLFEIGPWLALALAAAIPLIFAGPRAKPLTRRLGRYRDAVSKTLLALLAASSFTLLAPVPSGRWTPDLPARIGALQRVEAQAGAEAEASRQLIAAAKDDALLPSLSDIAKALARLKAADVCGPMPVALQARGPGTAAAPRSSVAPCPPAAVSAAIRERGGRDGVTLSPDQQRRIADQSAAELGKALVDRALAAAPAAPPYRPPAPAAVTGEQVRARAVQVLTLSRYVLRLRPAAVEAAVSSIPLTGREMADEVIRPVLEHLLDRLGAFVLKLTLGVAARHGGQPLLDADVRARAAAALHAVLARPAAPDAAVASFAADVGRAEQGRKDALGRRLDELVKQRSGEAAREPR